MKEGIKKTSEKVFVLGLDGGAWNLLKPLMERGHMPNLQKVCSDGVSGILRSTIPPYTAPAWVSSVTGMNPGKHSVFGFTTNNNGETKRAFVSSRSVKTPKLWHYLNNAGMSAGVINLPITYPAEPINGFMVPGLLTPLGKEDFTHPEGLYKELIKEIGSYVINVRIAGRRTGTEGQLQKFVEDLILCTQKRIEATEVLLRKYTPDFFMVVFTCFDKIQHKYWKYLDKGEAMYNTPVAAHAREELLKLYRLVDDGIGRILSMIDEDTTFYIVSDHGFGPLEKTVSLNEWLLKEGLLSLSKTRLYATKFIGRMHIDKFFDKGRNIAVAENALSRCIDFSKTVFFSSDVYEQGIYFNKEGSDYSDDAAHRAKKIKELRAKLLTLIDPANGKRFVDEVYLKDELYNGPYVKNAPDLLLRMKNYGYMLNTSVSIGGGCFVKKAMGPEGCHRQEGIFAAYGKNIRKGLEVDADITDITPTVLYNFNLPVPEDMDGKVVNEIFTSDFRATGNLRHSATSISGVFEGAEETKYSPDEEKEIEGRLKDLGYFD